MDAALRAEAEAWRDDDPDPITAAALDAALAAGDADAVAAGFAEPLAFGTAGLRGPLGFGPGRMNAAVVRRLAAGACAWLDAQAIGGPVVIGRDARHGSAEFARDAAGVVAATGREAIVADGPVPTPLVAYACRALGAAAGLVVTASHNPPADNGVKVYGPDAAQITAPVDAQIAAHLAAIASVRGVSCTPEAVRAMPAPVVDAYLDACAGVRVGAPGGLRVVATAMHGVGAPFLTEALERAGFGAPVLVAEQASPDPDFPTVAFPNPEEPGAMDLLLALASAERAELALANDPDADRLAVAVPGDRSAGGWRVLTGDEVGVLLADHLLRHGSSSEPRLVATTIVSSSMLAAVAASHGAVCETTLTGFKWLARARDRHPGARPVLAYEEALGYCVGDVVRDKDGIGAAVAMCDVAVTLRSAGSDVLTRLAELAVEHGLHRTRQRSVRYEGAGALAAAAATVDRLVASTPAALAGRAIVAVDDLRLGAGGLPPTEGVRLVGERLRVVVRPSGTEPKLKIYVEVVSPVPSIGALAGATAEADATIDAVLDELVGWAS